MLLLDLRPSRMGNPRRELSSMGVLGIVLCWTASGLAVFLLVYAGLVLPFDPDSLALAWPCFGAGVVVWLIGRITLFATGDQ